MNGRWRCISPQLASGPRARTSARAERTRSPVGHPGEARHVLSRMSAVGRPAEDARPPFMSQAYTRGDAILLALLLAADFTWLIADAESNQVSLPLALVWSLFVAYVAFAERRANPDEFVVALTTALWCFGNGFWTLSDFAEWRAVAERSRGDDASGHDGSGGERAGAPLTYAGVDFYDTRTLDNLAGACFLVASLAGVAYYSRWRYTPFFLDARRARADGLKDARAAARADESRALVLGEDGADTATAAANVAAASRPEPSGADRPSVRETLATPISDPFLGPAFTPNALRVQSRAEYESLSHFLWIAKDLWWWVSVEMDDALPGALVGCAKAVTVLTAAALIAHTFDALAVAIRDAPPDRKWARSRRYGGEVVTKLGLVFWVVAMTVWSFGEMFAPDPEARIGAEVRLFSARESADAEGPDSSRWWAAWSMAIGAFVLAAFLGHEAIAAVCVRETGDPRDSRAAREAEPFP